MAAQVSIGPWIENGFYYDFDPVEPFVEKDLKRIKKEMDRIISMKLPFTEEDVTREEVARRIEEQNEPYKMEILNRIKSDRITVWHTSKNQDGWWDLCAGPHVEHTGMLPREVHSPVPTGPPRPGLACMQAEARTDRRTTTLPCRRSNSSRSRGPTFSETRAGRCCSAFTGRRGSPRGSSRSTSGCMPHLEPNPRGADSPPSLLPPTRPRATPQQEG